MATKDSVAETYRQLMMLQFVVRNRSALHQSSHPAENPAAGQGRVLAFLKFRDGVSTKELAQILGMRVSSLNEMLVKMEAAGFIERRKSETDGRVMLCFITQKGKEVRQSRQVDVLPIDNFSEDELQMFEKLLERVIANIMASLDEETLDYLERWQKSYESFWTGMQDGPMRGNEAAAAPVPFGNMQGFGHFGRFPGLTSPRGAAPYAPSDVID